MRTDIRELSASEVPTAADILAEGMRDNPLHVRAFGADVATRQRRLSRFLGHLTAHVQSHGSLLGAFLDDEMIAVLGMMKPGNCRPKWREAMRFARVIVASNPPSGSLRIFRWLLAWRNRDAVAPHWHIGPLAVRPSYRRAGVGRSLMTRCCNDMDARGATAFLETDLAINVAFYETMGFVVVRRDSVLGVTNWFMCRPPARGAQERWTEPEIQ